MSGQTQILSVRLSVEHLCIFSKNPKNYGMKFRNVFYSIRSKRNIAVRNNEGNLEGKTTTCYLGMGKVRIEVLESFFYRGKNWNQN